MNHDDPLKKALQGWEANVDLPARFQAEVWQRIADRSAKAPSVSWLQQWIEWIPNHAVALAIVFIFMGIGLAQFPKQRLHQENERQLEARYVDSIDPYARAIRTS